ncbi:MAG: SH3 domain-containing protein [Clostridia bacterium]|nr:SH3 domain-containing protein [Clostridia bacterium]
MKKIIISLLIVSTVFLSSNVLFAMRAYEKVDFVTGLVTATALNVRTGPSTNYRVIGTVYKNEYIRVFAKIGEWYVIQTPSDQVGAVSSKYVKAIYANNGSTNTQKNNIQSNIKPSTNVSTNNDLNAEQSGASAEEIELLKLINKQRTQNGLSELKFDAEVQRVAKIKAQDLVDNNYFSHNSPIYGSPFEMMKSFGITYKAAGENIAGNSTIQGAVTAWMNSEGHKANILSNAYNYTGIGIVESPKYGKVMVQMFIGK